MILRPEPGEAKAPPPAQRRSWRGWHLLMAAGLACIAFGGYRWHTTHEIQEVAEEFARAMQSGQRSAAVQLLGGETQRLLGEGEAADSPWTAAPDLRFRVGKIVRRGDTATVDIYFERQGFSLVPRLTMHKAPGGEWKITRIFHPGIDPRWLATERAVQRASQEQLAGELKQALEPRGVEVSR